MTKYNIYKKGLLNYGYITLLFLLDNNEKLENYEECVIIKQMLTDFSLQYNITLPLIFEEKQLEEYKNFPNGELLIMNLPFYAEEIQMQIKDFENNSIKKLDIPK